MVDMPSFVDVPELWERGGSLRDVYFLGIRPEHWQGFLGFVREFPHQYSVDGQRRVLPPLDRIVREAKHHAVLLTVLLDTVHVNWHFFCDDEMDLDLDSREITGPTPHENVLRFLARLFQRLGKRALITPEGNQESPVLSYEPDRHAWRLHTVRTDSSGGARDGARRRRGSSNR